METDGCQGFAKNRRKTATMFVLALVATTYCLLWTTNAQTCSCRAPAGPCETVECKSGVCSYTIRTGQCSGDTPCTRAGFCNGKPECPVVMMTDGTSCDQSVMAPCTYRECQKGACVAVFKSNTTKCGAQTSLCTAPQFCDGRGNCKPGPLPVGTPCGPATGSQGPCQGPDECSPSGKCDQLGLFGTSTKCREAADACDFAEFCDGKSGTCPPDKRNITCDVTSTGASTSIASSSSSTSISSTTTLMTRRTTTDTTAKVTPSPSNVMTSTSTKAASDTSGTADDTASTVVEKSGVTFPPPATTVTEFQANEATTSQIAMVASLVLMIALFV
jgi:hypothetical protein